MSNIVQRLRSWAEEDWKHRELFTQTADEIESLRRELRLTNDNVTRLVKSHGEIFGENKALRRRESEQAARIERLELALGRASRCIGMLLRGSPVRDADETLCEIAAALWPAEHMYTTQDLYDALNPAQEPARQMTGKERDVMRQALWNSTKPQQHAPIIGNGTSAQPTTALGWLDLIAALDAERCPTLCNVINDAREWRATHGDDVQRDAERYRWLRERLFAADFEYRIDDNIEAPMLVFHWPPNARIGPNLDAAIDAASAAQPLKGTGERTA